MKNYFYKFLKIFIFISLFIFAVNAQIEDKTDKKLLSEITLFRQKLVEAIEKRDRKTLETFFAEDFTHTHAIGKIDEKTKRIDSILTGDKTLESVQPDEIKIRFYGKNTAIAVGQTTISDETGEAKKYRWTTVYIKSKNSWQIVASQATRLP